MNRQQPAPASDTRGFCTWLVGCLLFWTVMLWRTSDAVYLWHLLVAHLFRN